MNKKLTLGRTVDKVEGNLLNLYAPYEFEIVKLECILYFVGLLQQFNGLKRYEASQNDANESPKSKQHLNEVLFSNTPSTQFAAERFGEERRQSEQEEATLLSW